MDELCLQCTKTRSCSQSHPSLRLSTCHILLFWNGQLVTVCLSCLIHVDESMGRVVVSISPYREVTRLVSVLSWLKLSISHLGFGHLLLMPETNFRPNCAGQNNKKWIDSLLWVPSSFHSKWPLIMLLFQWFYGGMVMLFTGQRTCDLQVTAHGFEFCISYLHVCASVTEQYNLIPTMEVISLAV